MTTMGAFIPIWCSICYLHTEWASLSQYLHKSPHSMQLMHTTALHVSHSWVDDMGTVVLQLWHLCMQLWQYTSSSIVTVPTHLEHALSWHVVHIHSSAHSSHSNELQPSVLHRYGTCSIHSSHTEHDIAEMRYIY
jgi:hypothetical protein